MDLRGWILMFRCVLFSFPPPNCSSFSYFEEYNAATEWSHGADASTVKIILPGFKKEEIRVLVDNHGNLRTRGERPVAGNRWSRFQKDFQIPGDCYVDGTRAKFENEALTITIPKKNPSLPQAAPMPAPTRPEPRRPAMPPPHRPPPALPEPAKPSPPTPRAPVLPPAPSQKPVSERRPSLPRKPPAAEPARPAPPVPAPTPEVEPPKKYNGGAATELAAVPKPTEEWVKETKKPQAVPEEEYQRLMEREARGKMVEDRKMVEEKEKKAKEEERMMGEMDMAQPRGPVSASRGLLVNVAVAVVVLIGITVYVWRNLSGGGGDHGVGDVGAGIYGDEM